MNHFPAARPAQLELVIFLMVVLLVMLTQACASEGLTAPVEPRAQALDKEIMCPICPGESIDQSQTECAKQMRAFAREKLAEGCSEEQIKQYYVDRFGPRILMAPPQEGLNQQAWASLVVFAGAMTVLLLLRPRCAAPMAPAPSRSVAHSGRSSPRSRRGRGT
jgi:cytochrome c-type biogenesis protein CcmH